MVAALDDPSRTAYGCEGDFALCPLLRTELEKPTLIVATGSDGQKLNGRNFRP